MAVAPLVHEQDLVAVLEVIVHAHRGDPAAVVRSAWSRYAAEAVEARDVAPDDQGVDVVGALVGVDGFQVQHVSDHRVLVDDPGGAENVARHPRGVERHLHVVHLRHRDLLGPHPPRVLEPSELQAQELGLGDLGDHPHELLLHELERRDGLAELDALLRVLQGPVVAGHGGADGPPRDAVARLAQTRQRPPQSGDARQLVLERDAAVLEAQLGRDRGAHGELAVDVQGAEPGSVALHQVAPDLAVVALGPHHRHVRDRAVGDPQLGPVRARTRRPCGPPASSCRPGRSRDRAR